MTDEWTPPPKTYWPTVEEVRQITAIILAQIASSPDWAPTPGEGKMPPAPDETWKGWRR